MMMEWNRVGGMGIEKTGRKCVQRIGKIFGDELVEDKEGEGDKIGSQAPGVTELIMVSFPKREEGPNGCARGFCSIVLAVGMGQGWGKACRVGGAWDEEEILNTVFELQFPLLHIQDEEASWMA